MHYTVNGESVELDAKTVRELLVALGYEDKKVTVAVNETFVPNTDWSCCRINEGDRFDVLSAIAGG